MAWWATVYHLWIQRNCRIQGGEVKTEEKILKSITRDVKAKMEAKSNLDNSILNKVLCINWGILGSALEINWGWGRRSVYKRYLEAGYCFSSFETGLVSLVLNWWVVSKEFGLYYWEYLFSYFFCFRTYIVPCVFLLVSIILSYNNHQHYPKKKKKKGFLEIDGKGNTFFY